LNNSSQLANLSAHSKPSLLRLNLFHHRFFAESGFDGYGKGSRSRRILFVLCTKICNNCNELQQMV